jgi:hypothetical protein
MALTLNTKTAAAFDELRSQVGARFPEAEKIKHSSECLEVGVNDGLLAWCDGPAPDVLRIDPPLPVLSSEQLEDRHLWVVRPDDVVHCQEQNAFGQNYVDGGVIKHTNLTGGREAHSAGELIFLDDLTIILTGRSGRYGPRSRQEMEAVEKAFRKSGYYVWSCGYDTEAGKPLDFDILHPVWIAAT